MDDGDQRGIHEIRYTYFASFEVEDWRTVNTLEGLTIAIELYRTLISLKRYEDAASLFRDRLEKPMLYRLSANRQRTELLEMLFPDGLEESPPLERRWQAFFISDLATAYTIDGQPGRATPLYHRALPIIISENKRIYWIRTLHKLAVACRQSGALRESEVALYDALRVGRMEDFPLPREEAVTLRILGYQSRPAGRDA